MTAPEPDVWERLEPAWHATFAVFVLVTGALVLTTRDAPAAQGLALLAAVAACYALLGGPALRRPTPAARGIAYLAMAAPATIVLFALTPVGSVMLFVLFPMVWRLLPTRAAMLGTSVLVVGVALVRPLRQITDPADLPVTLALYGGLLVTTLLLGAWITSIAEQSRRRAGLLAELERTRTELAAAHHEAGALAERERLAREIHDTLAQGFTSLVLLARAGADELDRDPEAARRHLRLAERTARENLDEARTLVRSATPAALATAPLPTALHRLVAGCGDELGIEADFRADPVGPPDRGRPDIGFPAWAERDVALLRLTQEAIANVRRHSAASRLAVTLCHGSPGTRLEIVDDGRGFDTGTRPAGSFGLAGMRQRIAELGGTLVVDSAPGAGCRLVAHVPDPGPGGRAPDDPARAAA